MSEFERTTDESDTDPVNYLAAMPPLSSTPGRFEAVLKRLLRARGALRPVVRDDSETIARSDGESVTRARRSD